MAVTIPSNLGSKVVSRDTSWNDLVQRAWGSEFNAPDHNIYKFSNGRGYDSTDRGLTGIYGVVGDNMIYLNNRYPDMRDGILVNQDGVTPLGALNNGFGNYQDIVADSPVDSSSSSGGNVVETDPQFPLVQLLNFGASAVDLSSFHQDFTTITNCLNVGIGDGTMQATTAWKPNSQSDARLITPSSNIWTLPASSAPFALTLEFSIKVYQNLVGTNWGFSLGGGVYFQFTPNGAGITRVSPAAGWGPFVQSNITNGSWHDIAYCHDELNGRIFVDGVLQVGAQPGQILAVAGPSAFGVVGRSDAAGLPGLGYLLTNIRITWGYARYGANYTVRTTPFPLSGP